MLPFIILVVSVLLIQAKVKKMKNQGLYGNERMIWLHLAIFITYLVMSMLWCIMSTVSRQAHREKDQEKMEKYIIAFHFFEIAMWVCNMALLGLFTYLSIEFSEPITSYRENFIEAPKKLMLAFQKNNISTIHEMEREFPLA